MKPSFWSRAAVHFDVNAIGERQVHGERKRPLLELAELDVEPRAEFVGRPARDDLNGTAVRIAAEQRPLRAAQHLDALDLDEAPLEEARRCRS